MNLKRLCIASALMAASVFAVQAYAADTFTVTVKAVNFHPMGLGFTLDGAKHGTAGSTFTDSKATPGNYSFGFQTLTKKVGCTYNGDNSISLSQSTTVSLHTNAKKNECTISLNNPIASFR